MSAASASVTTPGTARILVASSRADFRQRVLKCLAPSSGQTGEAAGGADALIKLESNQFATVLLDPEIEDLDVPELVDVTQQLSFEISGRRVGEPAKLEVENAVVEAQPVCVAYPEVEFPRVQSAPQIRTDPLPGMIGSSLRMQQLYRLARLVAPRDTAVLIAGPTGTGKELVARGIHEYSRRSRGPFVVVNCAAIPESLLEAELFGFTRGAFTGAFQSRLGRIHAAHGGTLLLDEVGELPLGMQAKLLRFVQEGEVQRLGSADLFRVDTRLIAATNADLLQRVQEKQFREDLYYRLAVFPLHVPPLRNRPEDIIPLAQHFLGILCAQAQCREKNFTAEAVKQLRQHAWPGNVRELQHGVERAFVLAEANEQIAPEFLSLGSETN